MRTAVAIAIAGAVGALARYGLQSVVDTRTGGFPWGTLVVNVSGCFALGFIFTLTAERLPLDPPVRLGLTVGFLGAYTTFSTLAFDTLQLIEGSHWDAALLNLGGSAIAGVLAVAAGMAVGSIVA